MTYTYDDFVTQAKNAGMYDSFGQEDLTMAQSKPEYGLSLLKLQQDAGKATTEEQKLLVQEAVNQLRSSYGVVIPSASTGQQPYSYGRETDYQKLLNGVTTPSSFDFDHRTDETYGAMKDSWIADGDRTQDRVLQGSTVPGMDWAKAAGQQGNNYYDTKLTDQIPTVYQNAYEEYQGKQTMDQSKLDAVAGDRDFDYAKYLQQIQLDQAKAQQDFNNALLLDQEFGTGEPVMPDLDNLTSGADTTYTYGQDNAYKDALDAVVNQEEFAYDHRQDPLYGATRKSMLREGDRAAADTMAELSARTGGVASSYGVRAALDAGNQYNQELNAAIPGLRKTAYQEYLGDFEGKLQGLGALQADRDFDYQKWLQDYQLQEAARQQEFENALAMYEKYGLTPEIAAILGVPYEESDDGGSGPSPDGKEPKPSYNQIKADYVDAANSGASSEYKAEFLNEVVKAGYINQKQADKIASIYQPSKEGYSAADKIWDRNS